MSKKKESTIKNIFREIEGESSEVPHENDPSFDSFMDLLLEFPDEAKEKFPWYYRRWEVAAKNIPSWEIASLFKSIVEHFSSKMKEANSSISSLREAKLKEQLELLHIYISLGESTTDSIVKAAYAKYKVILTESLAIVEKELLKYENINRKQKKLSFIWQGDVKELDVLYSQLMKENFLSADTDEKNFNALFSGVPLEKIKPLQWNKAKNLLAYLIDQLHWANKLPDETNFWDIANCGFVGASHLVKLRTNYKNNSNHKPRGYKSIDNIIAALK